MTILVNFSDDICHPQPEVERVLKICTQVQVQVVAKIILEYKQKYGVKMYLSKSTKYPSQKQNYSSTNY